MKILFDTNLVLDVLLARKPFVDEAAPLVDAVERSQIYGYLGATTVTTLHYYLGRQLGVTGARAALSRLLSIFEVAPVSRLVLQAALDSRITDFEDAVLAEAGYHIGAEGLVTRNASDFQHSPLRVYSPAQLLTWLRRQTTDE